MLRLLVAAALAWTLCGCSVIYKLPTRQGNVIDQKAVDQLKIGMSKDQVRFLLGTPVASSPFSDDRWDYFGYYKPPRGESRSRLVTLYFENDHLTRMQGTDKAANEPSLGTPDFGTLAKEEKKDQTDKARSVDDKSQTGINVPAKAP